MRVLVTFCFLVLIGTMGLAQKREKCLVMEEAMRQLWEDGDFDIATITLQFASPKKKHNWVKDYCLAFSNLMLAWEALEAKDLANFEKYYQIAATHLTAAKQDEKNHSEILTLEAFYYQIGILSNPATNGPKYYLLVEQALEKALALDENNPRVYFLWGQQSWFKAKFFGVGQEKALAYFQKAATLYDSVEEEKRILPNWGETETHEMLAMLTEQ